MVYIILIVSRIAVLTSDHYIDKHPLFVDNQSGNIGVCRHCYGLHESLKLLLLIALSFYMTMLTISFENAVITDKNHH